MLHIPAARCDARRGFTLVELLVVIGVIGLVLGLLLPALSRARLAGRQSVTLARLRDLGIGASAYAMDYKDRFPALRTNEEKAFLGLSVLSKHNEVPVEAFININTTDSPATARTADHRPVLAELDGSPIDESGEVSPSDIARVGWHCSFSYDNDIRLRLARRSIVFMGDRADYEHGRTLSANWGGAGMCLLWTDTHAAFVRSRTIAEQSDPNIYHHNEFGGEGSGEVREGVSVTPGTLDTHLRFFSEEEDDALLTDPE